MQPTGRKGDQLFLRDIGRIYVFSGLAIALVVVAGWIWVVDSMSIAHSTPLWRRLWLPRSAVVANGTVSAPPPFAVLPRPRGARVIYRFPAFTRDQATFVVQVERFKDSTSSGRAEKRLKRCDSLPTSCTTWFADTPANHVKCTEAHLGVDHGYDLGYFGYCWPTSGPAYAIYDCGRGTCPTARQILAKYFMGGQADQGASRGR
jgi:hypothetical protein